MVASKISGGHDGFRFTKKKHFFRPINSGNT